MSPLRLSIIGDCTIDVENNHVTPAASRLFGLLLLLSLRDGKPISRQEIQALLLGDAATAVIASHNLRQLLYRLRQMGLRFHEQAAGLALCDAEAIGPLEQLRQLDTSARSRLTLRELEVLPSYLPGLTKPFSAWIEDVRSDVEGQIRQLLLSDLETLRASHAWRDVIRLCETLASLDAGNETVVLWRAEALAMIGAKEEALRVLDRFSRAAAQSTDVSTVLQCIRNRIAKTPIVRREGTLRARASCLSFLESEWDKLPSEEGARLSAVVGHAGLGKTRVAEEYAARISLRGGHVVRFDCDSQSLQQPLALFSHILPSLRAMRGSLGASPDYKSALALVRPTSDSAEPTLQEGLSLEARRAEIQSALIDLLEAVTSERPLLLIVDDAHVLDEASRSVLRAVTTTRNAAALQVLACVRPSSGNATLLAPGRRISAFELAPLSADDSRELLLELQGHRDPDDDYLAWSLKQAAGNPFYLHQLASHSSASSIALPFDISSLALSSYSSLPADSRTVLETCLMLGRYATVDRAVHIAGLDEQAMLTALRELEQHALVHFIEGHLTGPHALLHDAIRDLIPSSVSAMIHRRIAARLEEECVADRFTSSLAWASAQSWLAAGDPIAATHLLRRCASHAAKLGEPATAVELLSQITISMLPPVLQGEVLDDLNRFANAGGLRAVAATALRDRLRLAHDLGEGSNQVALIQLRIIEAELLDKGPSVSALESLTKLLSDTSADSALRAKAAARLFTIADADLDSELAHRVRASMGLIECEDSHTRSLLARADLVYHTAFGDINSARTLALELKAAFLEPSTLDDSVHARTYFAYAFYRIGDIDEAWLALETSYNFLIRQRMHSAALYAASLLADLALSIGAFHASELWTGRGEAAARGMSPQELNPYAGFTANTAARAMRRGRYDEAEALLREPLQRPSMLTASRCKAVSLALLQRLERFRSGRSLGGEEVALLGELYERGRSLGCQDPIVEALWYAKRIAGDSAGASRMLKDYLCVYRREGSLPDWWLRDATADDTAWEAYYSRPGAPQRPRD